MIGDPGTGFMPPRRRRFRQAPPRRPRARAFVSLKLPVAANAAPPFSSRGSAWRLATSASASEASAPARNTTSLAVSTRTTASLSPCVLGLARLRNTASCDSGGTEARDFVGRAVNAIPHLGAGFAGAWQLLALRPRLWRPAPRYGQPPGPSPQTPLPATPIGTSGRRLARPIGRSWRLRQATHSQATREARREFRACNRAG